MRLIRKIMEWLALSDHYDEGYEDGYEQGWHDAEVKAMGDVPQDRIRSSARFMFPPDEG